jgi:hypothetical protein
MLISFAAPGTCLKAKDGACEGVAVECGEPVLGEGDEELAVPVVGDGSGLPDVPVVGEESEVPDATVVLQAESARVSVRVAASQPNMRRWRTARELGT